MQDQKIACAICHKEQKSPKGLGQHVRRQHGLSAQEYYDQWVKVDEDEGVCPICGRPTPFLSIQRGYQRFCSSRCANQSDEKRATIRRHIAERTDEEQEEINAKCRQSRLEHYGDESYGLYGSDSFKQLMEERYGDEHYNNLDKMLATNRQNNGGILNLQTPEFKEQARRTKLERYGADHDMEKTRQTNLERYGCEYPWASPETMARVAARKRAATNARFKERLAEENISVTEYDDAFLAMRCQECGNDFSYSRSFLYHKVRVGQVCPFCHPRKLNYDSNLQAEIADFVEATTSHLVSRDNRTEIWPQELDIYIPDLAIAFEVDGMYWHSTEHKEPSYHLDKTKLCQGHGITLYHIFECEWVSKRPIVESRIRSILGIYGRRIYARKCELRNVPPREAQEFFEENHLQGAARASVTYGLYAGDELVEAMSFGRPRFNKECSWEIIRMCSKLDTQIVGGAARLLAAFRSEHKGEGRLISYADLRWSTGSVYESLGFDRTRTTPPDYWYFVDNASMTHRSAYQKHKLPDLLPVFDPALTEQENMLANGFGIIYDCGNAVYEREL